MFSDNKVRRGTVDKAQLPPDFPTHRHDPAFWERLGRVVATFAFMEEVLGKAIFAFTATRPYTTNEVEQAFADWLPTLERALYDPLGGLVESFGKAVRAHPGATISNFDALLDDLRKASTVRNVLCHGSWRTPDAAGGSTPLFVNRQLQVFDTPVDIEFLSGVQRHAAELACEVVSTVTHMGWSFPGSSGLGRSTSLGSRGEP